MKIIRIDSVQQGAAPKIALIADSAIRPDNRPLFLPEGEWICELRLAVRVDRLGKFVAKKFASRYYESCSIVNYLRPIDDEAFFGLIDDAVVQGCRLNLPADGEHMLDIQSDVKTNSPMTISRDEIDYYIERLSENVTFKTGDLLLLPQVIHSYTPRYDMAVSVKFYETKALEFTIK